MKKIILKSALLATVLVSFCAGNASAGTIPNTGWNNVEDFLTMYGNGYSVVNYQDFNGPWEYTAIAYESDNTNITRQVTGGPTTFSTADLSNWGQWARMNFYAQNLRFKDVTDGTQRILDVFGDQANDTDFFKVFRLTAASDELTWLGTGYKLAADTLIVGWNDNGINTPDFDYDDIIVAMNPVPEPATMLLFGTGLAGLAGVARRRKMK